MRRNRLGSIVLSLGLIACGMLGLAFALLGGWVGLQLWQLWPLSVVVVGFFLVSPPLFTRGKRGLGVLFIPGLPILATGGLLLFASVFWAWGAWSWLWPMVILGLAMGFLFAALHVRASGLLVPAIIIGANGALMQFCAVTGWWSIWRFAWAIEPLAVGLALLALYLNHRSPGLLIAGLVLCAIAALGFFQSVALTAFSLVVPVWLIWRLGGPMLLITSGFLVLLLSLLRRPRSPLAAE